MRVVATQGLPKQHSRRQGREGLLGRFLCARERRPPLSPLALCRRPIDRSISRHKPVATQPAVRRPITGTFTVSIQHEQAIPTEHKLARARARVIQRHKRTHTHPTNTTPQKLVADARAASRRAAAAARGAPGWAAEPTPTRARGRALVVVPPAPRRPQQQQGARDLNRRHHLFFFFVLLCCCFCRLAPALDHFRPGRAARGRGGRQGETR